MTFAVVGRAIVHAVDHKPKTTRALARLEDLRRDPRASLLADHYDEDWSQLWWVRADGTARVLDAAEAPEAIDALAEKYPQYAERRPDGPVVVLAVQRISGWEARRRDVHARARRGGRRRRAGAGPRGQDGLDARREARARAQRLAQRGHEIPLDHVEQAAGDGVLPVEELLEQVARQDEQERSLARDRGDGDGPPSMRPS